MSAAEDMTGVRSLPHTTTHHNHGKHPHELHNNRRLDGAIALDVQVTRCLPYLNPRKFLESQQHDHHHETGDVALSYLNP